MSTLYILDTDHITLLQRRHPSVISRLSTLSPEDVVTTIISAMEQVRGRLAQIHRAKTSSGMTQAFLRFQEALLFYRTVTLLPYDESAAEQFARLRHNHKKLPGTQDLRIASITLSRGATLVTRNRRDFIHILDLPLEDWSVPQES